MFSSLMKKLDLTAFLDNSPYPKEILEDAFKLKSLGEKLSIFFHNLSIKESTVTNSRNFLDRKYVD